MTATDSFLALDMAQMTLIQPGLCAEQNLLSSSPNSKSQKWENGLSQSIFLLPEKFILQGLKGSR